MVHFRSCLSARVLSVALILALPLFLAAWNTPGAPRIVRVGIYENPPKIYTNSEGDADGFWPEIVSYLATKENWQIVWVHGTWEENLDRLSANEIDMMPDVGWTTARNQVYTFSDETVLVSWARLYVPAGSKVETILDLEGKKVAGLSGSLSFDGSEGIKDLAQKFEVNCTFIGIDSYEKVFEALKNNEVDAGVANKDYGDQNESKYNVVRTPVILQPTSLRFAFTKGGAMTPYLLETIDEDIRVLKEKPNSVYYEALDYFLSESSLGKTEFIVPAWVYVAISYSILIIAALFVITLVTRKQVRLQTASLRASETRNRVLVENNPDMIFRLSGDGIFLDYHTSQETLSEITTGPLIGKNVENVLDPDLAALTRTKIKKAIETNELQTYEYQLREGKQTREYEARMKANGENETIAIIRDITDRKQYEKNMKASEMRYQTLTTVVPVGIFRTDCEGLTTYVNKRWCEISGLPADKALGYGWLQAVHPDDREPLAANWQKSATRNRTSSADYRFVHTDGSIVWVIGQAIPEKDAAGKVIGYVGSITDITERKKMEELKEAVIKAESADKLKSAFLATMSHELRTPLNSIIGFTGILLQKLVGPLNNEQEKQLQMVQASARHLLDLINDVLDISKIEAGQMRVAITTFDMNDAIHHCLDEIKPMAVKKGLLVEVNTLPQPIMITSDRRRVEQILLNLLNNAVKFTERGKVSVHCEIKGTKLTTCVADTGIGIKPEDQQKLFKPFSQVEMGISRQYEGTGLGLSICRHLVELLGGKIKVRSEWGKGSEFIFTLPLEKGEK